MTESEQELRAELERQRRLVEASYALHSTLDVEELLNLLLRVASEGVEADRAGEHIIRAGGAISIACRYKSGIALTDAINELLDEVKRLGGDAGVIAITRDAEIATPYNSDGMKRASVSVQQALHVATFR